MRISELINDETWVKLMFLANKLEKSEKKQQPVQQKKKSQERLSKRELNDLMGVNRDIYKRSNGRVKRK